MKEILLLKCRDNNDYIRAVVSKMSNKFEKYWGSFNLLMALATVLDSRYKMKLIKFCFHLIYPEPEASINIDNVISALHELYEVCLASHNSPIMQLQQSAQENSHSTSGSTRVVAVKKSTSRSIFMECIRSNDVVQPTEIDAEFEALAWWKFNALKYCILSKMAQNILAVPITIVSSESSFNTDGRVIDPHRTRLSTKTVEMFLCGSDWARALHGLRKKLCNR